MYRSFAEIITKIQENKGMKNIAVVAAEDKHTLEAVCLAHQDKIANPILLGKEKTILANLKELNISYKDLNIINVEDKCKAAEKATELVHRGEADLIMKGLIETAEIMKIMLRKESGLRTERILSHLAFFELATYHKLLVSTDTGMVMYPTLEQKKQIISNAIATLNKMGIKNPKIALLSAVEKINPKMQDTLDAAELVKMYQQGIFQDCVIEGPISYDLAISKEIAQIKGYESRIAGDVDILVVPDITVGNILGKALVYSAKAKMAGFITGAKVPIILASRASSTQDKYLSIVLSVLAS